MTDRVSRDNRSAIMRAVHREDTMPEILVRKAAHGLGLRFRLRGCGLPGRPDLVFPRWKTVVFVNGCFWHRHPGCKRATVPKTNARFWQQKFARNKRRDAANYARLQALEWRVIVLWQCEVKTLELAQAAIRNHFLSSQTSARAGS